MNIDRSFSDRVRLAFASGVVLGLLGSSGCGTGERERPIVSAKTTSAAGAETSTDYPLGKPAAKKLPAKLPKQFSPIAIPAGPGNK
jgi:hypothetical protein